MKKVLKIILFILIGILASKNINHHHEYEEIIHDSSYSQIGYIEYVCNCGYTYKEKLEDQLGKDINNYSNKNLEDFKKKNNCLLLKNNIMLSIGLYFQEYFYEYISKVNQEEEKVYIVYMRFKGYL